MLAELVIEDLAVIERAELSFESGFNVITGETGAGKSLLVNAVEFLMGERPRGSIEGWIRAGCDRARVEGRFLMEDGLAARVRAWMEQHLPDRAEDASDELILSRALSRDGRTRAHLDHRPITLKNLKALAALLVEIHGQNDHQRVLDPVEQLRLVDAFGGLDDKLARYTERRQAWLALADRARSLGDERSERRDRLDRLRYQLGELEEARLEPGEGEGLREERTLLRAAGTLATDLGAWVERLSEGELTLVDEVRQALHAVEGWSEKLPSLAEPREELAAAALHLEEGASRLVSFMQGIEADPARLEFVEDRLADLERLERKYECRADELIERVDVLRVEIEGCEEEDRSAEHLGEELAVARKQLADAAGTLGRARRALRQKLATSVQAILAELGLANARFELVVEPRGPLASPNAKAASAGDSMDADRTRFGVAGADDVEFRLAANPGEQAGPLRHVASGGEAARIMLALRTVLSDASGKGEGRTLIFDEVDAGVGGRLGPAVAGRLAALSEHHQVLCVTHLPAIAAAADQHLRARKKTAKGRTSTAIERLQGDARVAEVADMIAGGADQKTARAEARRLLAR